MTVNVHYGDIEGQRVLITGASSGIGLACAEAFLGQGARVAAQFHNQEAPLLGLVQASAGRAYALRADLASEEGCVGLCEAAQAVLGGLDVLVHSAGIWTDGPILEMDRTTLETTFRTNTFSSYYLAREAARRMGHGSLIFIGSTAGQRGEPGHSHYAGSKGAVQSLVSSIAQELSPRIRVNLVSPGWVRTPMSEAALAEREDRIVAAVPLRRVAEAEDVASAVLFLASEASRHLTGVDLCCSGGALLPMPRG
ncbi:MAG: SDR family NAD(P)-dependent oxidoreductase [Acidobacteriota bacterium]